MRSPEEFAAGHLPGAVNIPHGELAARVAELSAARERDIVVYCRTGVRSAQALEVLDKAGFKRLFHLKGDYTRWSEEKRPSSRRSDLAHPRGCRPRPALRVHRLCAARRASRPALAVARVAAPAGGRLGGRHRVLGGICPLTPLENRLRAAGGEAGYDGGFIESHLEALIYPGWLTREIQIALGAVVLAVNLFAYARLRRKPN